MKHILLLIIFLTGAISSITGFSQSLSKKELESAILPGTEESWEQKGIQPDHII